MSPITFMTQARALLGLRLASGFAIFGGPSHNIAFPAEEAENDEDVRLSPYGSVRLDPSSPSSPRGWPGVVLGVQAS